MQQIEGFTPDPEGFTPDGFEADTPTKIEEAKKEEPKQGGKFITKGKTTQWVPDKPVDINKRPDAVMIGGIPKILDKLREYATDKVANGYLPESVKPYAAMGASLSLEPLRFLAEAMAQPETAVTGLWGSPLKAIESATSKAAEVVPPVAERKIAGLLPEGRGANYVAGPAGNPLGQVANAGANPTLVSPELAAKISGEAIPTPATPSGSFTDLDAIREAERLKGLYTLHEHQGGSRLFVPDKPNLPVPAEPGSTKLGFNKTSKGELPYPLNIAPEAVRPRSVQSEMSAVAPDRLGAVVEHSDPEGFIPDNTPIEEPPITAPKRPDYYSNTSAIQPGENILPSAREVIAASKNTGIPPQKFAAVAETAPPPVQTAIGQTIKEESKRPSLIKALYTDLKELSPELYAKSFRAVWRERQIKSEWIPQLQSAINSLSKFEKENFGGFVEGSLPIKSPKLQAAVDLWKQSEDAIGNEAMAKGLRMRTEGKAWMPFQKNTNYWPRIPTEDMKKPDVVDKLMKAGMTRNEANKIAQHYMNTGEIVFGPQHARIPNSTFPYRLDADVALAHVRSMARRIAQHTEFGPLDIQGKGAEGIADLIENTKDPQRALEMMRRVIGRDAKADSGLMSILNGARKYSTITKLQNFTIPNVIQGTATTAVKAASQPTAALKEVSQLLSKSYRRELSKSGVWQDFAHSLTEEIKPGMDWHGIGAGETINRGISGAVGRGVAKGYFKDLKANPADKRAASELFDLIGEKASELVKQNSLTPDQLQLAAGRMSEMTQGLNVPGNLPYWASSPVTRTNPERLPIQLALIFKKMGYQMTKTMWDAVKRDPARAIPAWMVASQVAGELTGDVKAAMKGAWQGDIQKPVEERGSFWLNGSGISPKSIKFVADQAGVEPEVVARLFDNYIQGFYLGLPADMLTASGRDSWGLLSAAAGPVLTDISKLANRVSTLDFKNLGKDAVSSLPIPGSRGIAESIFSK